MTYDYNYIFKQSEELGLPNVYLSSGVPTAEISSSSPNLIIPYTSSVCQAKPVSLVGAALDLIDSGLENVKSDKERALWINGMAAFASLLPK